MVVGILQWVLLLYLQIGVQVNKTYPRYNFTPLFLYRVTTCLENLEMSGIVLTLFH